MSNEGFEWSLVVPDNYVISKYTGDIIKVDSVEREYNKSIGRKKKNDKSSASYIQEIYKKYKE